MGGCASSSIRSNADVAAANLRAMEKNKARGKDRLGNKGFETDPALDDWCLGRGKYAPSSRSSNTTTEESNRSSTMIPIPYSDHRRLTTGFLMGGALGGACGGCGGF